MFSKYFNKPSDNKLTNSECLKFLSIDVGILNLAILEIDVIKENHQLKISEIKNCHLINITELVEWCSDKECTLQHNKCISDYMSHLFKNYPIFEQADKILVERQPLMGLVAVQEIINYQYSDKVELVSPNGMHAFFGINGKSGVAEKDYEMRKNFVTKYAEPYLNKFKTFNELDRKHDLGDTVCLLKYWLSKENVKLFEEKLQNDFKRTNVNFIKNMDSYKYSEECDS